MNYLTKYINFSTISHADLDKLIAIQTELSTVFCSHSIFQTLSNDFLNFSKAVRNKEEFFYPPYTKHQTGLKNSCETPVNSDPTPLSLNAKLGIAFSHGVLSGTLNASTAIALEASENKGHTKKQRRLIKAGLDILNSLAIASYATIKAYTENSQEPSEILIEKMWQSFAFSLAGTTSLYALSNGISYFAQSIENKLVKGFLNTLPLAGNLALLAKNENNLAETATSIGVNIASASIVSTAIQSGWHFFSKQRCAVKNNELELEISTNPRQNIISSQINETTLYANGIISVSNPIDAHYEEIEDGVVYASMERLDEENYLLPNPVNPVSHSTLEPALLPRNLRFLASGGLDVSAHANQDNISVSSADSFNSLTYKN